MGRASPLAYRDIILILSDVIRQTASWARKQANKNLEKAQPAIVCQQPHLASIVSLARFVIIDFSARNYNKTFFT
jgi:hypothetical protein